MSGDIDWNLLAKFLFGECTEEEAARVHRWMESDPKRRALVRQFRQVLEDTDDSSSSDAWDTEALWDRIQESTNPETQAVSSSTSDAPSASSEGREPRRRRRHPSRARRRRAKAWKRAVWGGVLAIAVVFISIVGIRDTLEKGAQRRGAEKVEIFVTEKGERATIRLSDGTHVRLNVNSTLTVPASFQEGKRTVELEGEAFFEVASDSTRPFLVHADETVTRVLGTAFDVSAYPEEDEAKVVVAEGRVALWVGADQKSQTEENMASEVDSVVLARRQMARILRTGEKVIHRGLDIRRHLTWMEGKLAFEDATFEEVVRSLERWYALDITLAKGDPPPNGHLNASFPKSQDLEKVLSVVATAFRLEYKHRGDTVIFERPG